MPTKKNSYISWLGENLVESAKNFESSLSSLLQLESKKIGSILESLDEGTLSTNTDGLSKINDMLCETLKYVESIQDVLSKKTLIGLYAMNYDDLKDKSYNKPINPKNNTPHTKLDLVEDSSDTTNINDGTDTIINCQPNVLTNDYTDNIESLTCNNESIEDEEPLDFESTLTPQDLLKMKDSPDFPYEIIDLGIELNNNSEIIINNIEDNDELQSNTDSLDDIFNDNYAYNNVNNEKLFYPPVIKKVSSNIINNDIISKKTLPNVQKTLDIIDDNSTTKSNTTPKVDVKFDDLIEIQIDTTPKKHTNYINVPKNITNDNITSISLNAIAEYTACESPNDISLSPEEKSLVESFGFFKDFYRV